MHSIEDAQQQRQDTVHQHHTDHAPDERHLQTDAAADVNGVVTIIPADRAEGSLLEQAGDVLHGAACQREGRKLNQRPLFLHGHGNQVHCHRANAVDHAERPPQRRDPEAPGAFAQPVPHALHHESHQTSGDEQPEQGRKGASLVLTAVLCHLTITRSQRRHDDSSCMQSGKVYIYRIRPNRELPLT